MRKIYPRTPSRRAIWRLGHAFYLLAFTLGGSLVFLLVRSFSHHATTKRTKSEEYAPVFPAARSPQKQPLNLGSFFNRLSSSSTTTQLATFFPAMSLAADDAMTVPEGYPSLQEFERHFEALTRAFPKLITKHVIGTSLAQHPIFALRVTDHPEMEEDEPALLFTALHHAREPVGVFICQALMEDLLHNYGQNPRQTRLVDSLDIWFVPLVNPDGYEYLMTQQRQFPWWRKNLRDNNNDGKFDPRIDGVDLNRNYDYNWQQGGESEASSWFYRGQYAFSEPETQALRDLGVQHNFILGVSFHSYGEAVLYPWGNFHRAPDEKLLLDIAQKYAAQIGKLAGGAYQVLPLDGRAGQSAVWRYGETGAIDFICEAGAEYFPSLEILPGIVAQNVRGGTLLCERALQSGIAGHVREAQSGAPLVAEIIVAGFESSDVKPRHSHGTYGRFDRLLLPGVYTVAVRKEGYRTVQIKDVSVNDSTLTYLEVELQRAAVLPSSTSH